MRPVVATLIIMASMVAITLAPTLLAVAIGYGCLAFAVHMALRHGTNKETAEADATLTEHFHFTRNSFTSEVLGPLYNPRGIVSKLLVFIGAGGMYRPDDHSIHYSLETIQKASRPGPVHKIPGFKPSFTSPYDAVVHVIEHESIHAAIHHGTS